MLIEFQVLELILPEPHPFNKRDLSALGRLSYVRATELGLGSLDTALKNHF